MKWIDTLPPYVDGSIGYAVVNGLVAGMLNPIVEFYEYQSGTAMRLVSVNSTIAWCVSDIGIINTQEHASQGVTQAILDAIETTAAAGPIEIVEEITRDDIVYRADVTI